MERRKFLKIGSGLTAISALPNLVFANNAMDLEKLKETDKPQEEVSLSTRPVVISTWNFGKIANSEAWRVLEKDGSALDAVEAAAIIIENDLSNKSVGIGGFPDSAGNVTLDACIMNQYGDCGSVAYLQNYKNPILLARAVMEQTPHVMLVGKGAEIFAASLKLEKAKIPKTTSKEYKKWKQEKSKSDKNLIENPKPNHENHDTIGILALDKDGSLSGACTTSGWAYKMPGRVGDSPLIGSGLFIDPEIGAACATGMGEEIIKVNGSSAVVEQMRNGHSPQKACEIVAKRVINRMKKAGMDSTNVQCAFIALDKNGNHGGFAILDGFQYAVKSNYEENLLNTKFVQNQ